MRSTVLAHIEDHKARGAEAAIKELDYPDENEDSKSHFVEAKFLTGVLELIDKVRSGTEWEYIAIEHGVETQT